MGEPILTSEDDCTGQEGTEYDCATKLSEEKPASSDWAGYAAGGALVAAGVLLVTGHRRAGLVAAAGGTALALAGQQEALRTCWEALPGYIANAQQFLNQVESAVEAVEGQRESLRRILTRERCA
jgi:hypothetical protein